MPPASPTAAASTTTPKGSSLARTAASPPLSPKTNVPARFSTRIRVGSNPLSSGGGTRASGSESLRAEPRAGREDHRLDPRAEGWVQHRREARVVVGRQLVQPVLFFGAAVQLRVGASDGPEHRRRVPLH